MPYRHAHWYVLAFLPLVALAFWPTYFAIFSSSPAALHAHAAVGGLWIALLAGQSWLIHHGRRDFHRQMGMASLGVFPCFLAASAVVFVLMAQQFANRLSPFDVAYDPRLGLGSIVLVAGFAYCYWQGLRWRRKVDVHSRYMLSTVFFLLPPIVVRLFRYVPLLQVRGPQELWKFALDIEVGNALVAAVAFFLASRAGRHGRPFREAGALFLLNLVLIPTVGVMPSWQRLFAGLAAVPLPAAAFVGGFAGIIIAWAGWLAGKRPTVGPEMLPA